MPGFPAKSDFSLFYIGAAHSSLARALLCAALILSSSMALSSSACIPFKGGQMVSVENVYDGDSLRLTDGRKIRLIGLNAPEVGYDGKPDQRFAREAKQRLAELVNASKKRVYLRHGNERRDRFGRHLAHTYTDDGSSLTAQLLEEGLAYAIVVPPNLRDHECHLASEARARAAGAGLWSNLSVKDARRIRSGDTGFQLVRGHVTRVGQGKRSVWINLEGGLGLRIDRSDLNHFEGPINSRLIGRKLEVRGWIYRHNGRLRMRVRHPAAIRWLGE